LPRRVAARLVENDPAGDSPWMHSVADLARHRAQRFPTLGHEHHATAFAGVFGESIAAMKIIAHAPNSIINCSAEAKPKVIE
jgi:hypothetical protein